MRAKGEPPRQGNHVSKTIGFRLPAAKAVEIFSGLLPNFVVQNSTGEGSLYAVGRALPVSSPATAAIKT